jgi:hypothetical protein
MKKFLFTLAAILMAGSLYAGEYFVCADTQIAQDQIGKNVNIDVKAHFDAYVSAWLTEIYLPENVSLVGVKKGADMTLTFLDEFGDETSIAPDITRQGTKLIVAVMAAQYSEDGEMYGVAKWAPGDYDQMMIMVVKCTEEFQGGEVKLVTDFSCGQDTRPEVDENRSSQRAGEGISQLTVEGATPELQDLSGEILIGSPTDEGKVSITYTGDEDVTILVVVNGVETPIDEDGNITISEGRSIIVVTVEAEGYNPKSLTGEIEWVKPVVPEVTEKPVITWEEVEGGVQVTATGDGHICLYVEDELVAEGEGTATYFIASTELEEEYGVSATAQEDGKEISDPAVETVWVPGIGTPEPEKTPDPVINYDDETFTVNVTGNGTIHVYVDGEEVTNPYTFEQGEEDVTYVITATAQEDGKEISGTVELVVVVPGTGTEPGPEPEDHNTGYWLVTYTLDGQEVWDPFIYDKGNYTMILPLTYETYGGFDYFGDGEENRPNINFRVVANGVSFGALEDGTIAFLGDAMQNPTDEGENLYVLEKGLGRVYNMGLFLVTDDNGNEEIYVYAAIAGYTDVAELNADKTVAGVRYFNMAGQEMQEANGMTIVVTTYTDGTTSAVKVMK